MSDVVRPNHRGYNYTFYKIRSDLVAKKNLQPINFSEDINMFYSTSDFQSSE